MPTEQLEIETKYDVAEATHLPALHELPGVASVEQPVELDLEAVYYDTEALDLAAHKVTLRRRTGGEDDGWHVKFPKSSGARLEVQHPLGRSTRTVPIAVVRTVRVHVRDNPLVPVVTLETRRVVHRLLDADGAVVAELADDHVTATTPGGEPDSWREWEVELVGGSEELLVAADGVLQAAGATPASGPSKLARALGDRVPKLEEWVLPAKPKTSDLFRAYAAEQVQAIRQRDPEVRRDAPEGIHKFRVATRRLRSALATYRPVVDREAGDALRAELKWLAGELGVARDAEVQRAHFAAEVAEQPAELVLGRVAGRIDDHLRGVYKEGRAGALAALESERYFRLLDALDNLLADPPLTGDDKKAAKQAPDLLHHDWKRMRKAVRRAETAETPEERDHELHEVRKSAKRLRYAGESAVPVLADEATALATRAEEVQEVLGDFQDSVVSRELLRELGVQVHLDGGNAFTFGRLHALQEARGEASIAAFFALWPQLKF
ncbi:CYTH and CHAD domain-containing protein [Kribbella sandramycini]|uniref:CHAD domain-containing protein n=1 Tax=Kribbella sandramycini TaxID=60450 RepID=A0A7Y4L691_9ACTN|nr:CYTH and CHAD domain-containing protein [Kribbella sandramycini]MBB6566127.1 CHAD domain-containing protein [Kribbella sandramycini]NOL45127.1 CYTH and CHAD domain-containing protein [Kribbella sandramycini]